MNDTDRGIAVAANLIAPVYAEHDLRWAAGSSARKIVPSAADIALTLRDLIDHLKPGMRAETSGLVVDWPDDADDGPDDEIAVYVRVGTLPAPPPHTSP